MVLASLRGAKRRSNPKTLEGLNCFPLRLRLAVAMTDCMGSHHRDLVLFGLNVRMHSRRMTRLKNLCPLAFGKLSAVELDAHFDAAIGARVSACMIGQS